MLEASILCHWQLESISHFSFLHTSLLFSKTRALVFLSLGVTCGGPEVKLQDVRISREEIVEKAAMQSNILSSPINTVPAGHSSELLLSKSRQSVMNVIWFWNIVAHYVMVLWDGSFIAENLHRDYVSQ